MPTPGGLVTKQELIDAQDDTRHLGEVSTGRNSSGQEIDTSLSRLGDEHLTVNGIVKLALDTVTSQAGFVLPQVSYSPGDQIVKTIDVDPENGKYAVNQVFEYNGALFVYAETDTLPYTLPPVFPGEPVFVSASVGVLSTQKSYLVGASEHPAGTSTLKPVDAGGNDYLIAGNTYLVRDNARQFEGVHYTISSDKTGFNLIGSTFRSDENIFVGFNYFGYGVEPVSGDSGTSGVYFAGIDNLKQGYKRGGNVDLISLATDGEYVNTMWYHDPENGGGGTYRLSTLQSYRDEISDQSWVPDGYRDHYLLDGTSYIALLVADVDGIEYAAQWGVKLNDESAVTATENVNRINAAVEYLCPFDWEGTAQATYFDKNLKEGTLIHARGFTCVNDTIHVNPGVTHRGVSTAFRPFGKINVFAGVKGSYLKGVGAYKAKYLVDTANWTDSTAQRNTNSKVTITNASADSKLVTWSEGSFLKDIYVVNGGTLATGGAFFGGVRLCLAMQGGWDGLAVSGFDNNLATNNCWNLKAGSLWLENSFMNHTMFECTNPIFNGPYTSVVSKSEPIPDRVFDNASAYFGSLLDGDTWVLPEQHKRQPKAIFSAYCWSPTFVNPVIEFAPNAICSYGDSDAEITFIDLREEGNAGSITVGPDTVGNTLITGWNTYVELVRPSLLSDTPLHAVGTSGSILIDDPRKMTGDTFNPNFINIRSAARPVRFTNWNRLNLSPKTLNSHRVILESSDFIEIYIDEATGNADYMGVSPSQPTTLYGFFRGGVASTDGTSLFRVARRGKYGLRLTGNQSHETMGPDVMAGADGAIIEMYREGGTVENTIISKADYGLGPLIDGGEIKIEGFTCYNGGSEVLRGDNNGVFRLTGNVKVSTQDLVTDRSTDNTDQVTFTMVNSCNVIASISGGDMNKTAGATGLFSLTFSGRGSIVGSFFGVNDAKLSPSSIPSTELITLVAGV